MGSAIFRMALDQRLGIPVCGNEFTFFDQVGDELTGSADQVRVQSNGPFEGGRRTLKHRRAAISVRRVVMVAKTESAPRRRVARVEAHSALEHSDGVFVGLGIVRQRDAAEIEIVGLFTLGAGGAFGGISARAEGGYESLANF